MREVTRPALRYHGGKFRLAPWIISNLPPHRVYVEPFCGAASVLLRKPRSYAEVINDLDGEIVDLFRVLRDRSTGAELERLLRLTPFARDEFSAAYELAESPIERARNTIIKSFMGFGSNAINKASGFRCNSNRSGTTPAHDWANYPDAMAALVDRMQGVVIENRDAIATISQHDGTETVFYVDPPYVFSTRNDGNADYAHEMTDADHGELANVLRNVRGMVVLSGYSCDLYESLYAGWIRIERRALADGAKERTEVLWMSPNTAQSQGAFALGAIA